MRTAAFVCLVLLAAGCQSSREKEEEGKQLTAGVVQREIRKGMSGAEVIEALGCNPNIVTGDEEGNEVWTYERYARNVETRQNGYWVVFLWGTGEQARSNTRSFTLILHFDKDKKVARFGYHVVTM